MNRDFRFLDKTYRSSIGFASKFTRIRRSLRVETTVDRHDGRSFTQTRADRNRKIHVDQRRHRTRRQRIRSSKSTDFIFCSFSLRIFFQINEKIQKAEACFEQSQKQLTTLIRKHQSLIPNEKVLVAAKAKQCRMSKLPDVNPISTSFFHRKFRFSS